MQDRNSPALDRVRRDIGGELAYNVITHDDGVDATGGESMMITGSMGSGKSTLEVQFGAMTCHVQGSERKEQTKFGNHAHVPETVIWRGRKYDHWTCFQDYNWARSFPQSKVRKPLVVHVHQDDHIRFITQRKEKVTLKLEEGTEIRYYSDVPDVFSHLVQNGINVIYEPLDYVLPSKIVRNLYKQKLRQEVSELMCTPIPAPGPLWWFEFCGHMLEAKQRREFITIIMDEAHQVFPANPPGDHWHLVAGFANQVIDFRKNNISFFPATQDANLLDYRITDRMTHFIWLRGSKPVSKRSRVSRKLVGCLATGKGIIEKANERFGLLRFDRIPNQPPVVMAEGLSTLL